MQRILCSNNGASGDITSEDVPRPCEDEAIPRTFGAGPSGAAHGRGAPGGTDSVQYCICQGVVFIAAMSVLYYTVTGRLHSFCGFRNQVDALAALPTRVLSLAEMDTACRACHSTTQPRGRRQDVSPLHKKRRKPRQYGKPTARWSGILAVVFGLFMLGFLQVQEGRQMDHRNMILVPPNLFSLET